MNRAVRTVRVLLVGQGRKVAMSNHASAPEGYEPPALMVLGSVHALTQTQDKKYGVSDGFTFMGDSITNAS
jgi:hypothetical protein